MPLGLILGLARSMHRKRTSSLDILSSKRAPRNYYKGKNCKPTGFHTRKGGYVGVQEKLPNYVVPDLTHSKVLSSRKEVRSKETIQENLVHSSRIDPSRVVQLSWQPRVFVYKDLISEEDCDHLISLAQGQKEGTNSVVSDT
uniref:Mitochondrial ribosomal protein L27 n=1 Tax=Chenopodium quinoa TaxID=63459 RepID=A0A803NBD6_CHEQI